MTGYFVYVHTCPNGKKYVGVTTQSPKLRWGKNGRYYGGQFFGKAIKKYGWDSITHEVFEVESKEEMYRREVELISFYHSNDPQYGYNCSGGGEHNSGFHVSEETRKLWSFQRKGRSPWNKGKNLSEEHKRHLSESHKGKSHSVSEKARKRISELLKGHPPGFFSEESRKKMSESRKGRPQPRHRYLLPDRTIKEMSVQMASKYYLNKGITLVIVD